MHAFKPLLRLKWRYWPALVFSILLVISQIGGSSKAAPPAQPNQQHATQSSAQENIGNKIVTFFGERTADDYIAVFTALTAFIFFGQLLTMNRTNEHFRVSERAYMNMSHTAELEFSGGANIVIHMQIKNWGKTPGTITKQVVGLYFPEDEKNLPILPPYNELAIGDKYQAFLVPTGVNNWDRSFSMNNESVIPDIANGKLPLLVIGYVDYTDKFGGRHRSGYARKYSPSRNGSGNNLVFMNTPGYNYDRARVRGEGD